MAAAGGERHDPAGAVEAARRPGDILRQSLPWPLPRWLDEALPNHFTAPTGSRVRIRYQPGQAPAIPVRIQEMFGLGATPCVADGRVPLVVELLSPAQRPLADHRGSRRLLGGIL